MSVRLMSLVFDYIFPKRVTYDALVFPFKRDKETWKITTRSEVPEIRNLATTGSSCKGTLLALADHANDDGKGAYPSVATLMRKTCLERPTVISAVLALQFHMFINFVGESPRETNNYDISPDRLVKPFDGGGKLALPVMVNPLYRGGKPALPESSYNHPETNDNDKATALISKMYESNVGAITPLIADFIRNAAIDFPFDWFEPAFKVAVKNNARNWNYVETVLDNWKTHGFGWKPESKNGHKPGNKTRPASETGKKGPSPEPTPADIELAREIVNKQAARNGL